MPEDKRRPRRSGGHWRVLTRVPPDGHWQAQPKTHYDYLPACQVAYQAMGDGFMTLVVSQEDWERMQAFGTAPTDIDRLLEQAFMEHLRAGDPDAYRRNIGNVGHPRSPDSRRGRRRAKREAYAAQLIREGKIKPEEAWRVRLKGGAPKGKKRKKPPEAMTP